MNSVVANVDDDADEFDDFIGDEDWEDEVQLQDIVSRYPEGWHPVKVVNFTEHTLRDVKQWCTDNCSNEWDQIGWYSGCSYIVGAIFESHCDAVMFKLIWGAK